MSQAPIVLHKIGIRWILPEAQGQGPFELCDQFCPTDQSLIPTLSGLSSSYQWFTCSKHWSDGLHYVQPSELLHMLENMAEESKKALILSSNCESPFFNDTRFVSHQNLPNSNQGNKFSHRTLYLSRRPSLTHHPYWPNHPSLPTSKTELRYLSNPTVGHQSIEVRAFSIMGTSRSVSSINTNCPSLFYPCKTSLCSWSWQAWPSFSTSLHSHSVSHRFCWNLCGNVKSGYQREIRKCLESRRR